jgi:hypothetical protein
MCVHHLNEPGEENNPSNSDNLNANGSNNDAENVSNNSDHDDSVNNQNRLSPTRKHAMDCKLFYFIFECVASLI